MPVQTEATMTGHEVKQSLPSTGDLTPPNSVPSGHATPLHQESSVQGYAIPGSSPTVFGYNSQQPNGAAAASAAVAANRLNGFHALSGLNAPNVSDMVAMQSVYTQMSQNGAQNPYANGGAAANIYANGGATGAYGYGDGMNEYVGGVSPYANAATTYSIGATPYTTGVNVYANANGAYVAGGVSPYVTQANHLNPSLSYGPLSIALPSPSLAPSLQTLVAASLMTPMMANPAAAAAAAAAANGHAMNQAGHGMPPLAGQPLQMHVARDKNCVGKLFIGGLSQQTKNEGIADYFRKFGPVKEAFVKLDTNTNRSRGFGFVTFEDPKDAQSAIDNGPHIVDGKSLDVKQAIPHNLAHDPEYTKSPKKVYVGGLPRSVDNDELIAYFAPFGELEDAMVMKDQSGNSRGFAYITYKKSQVAAKVVQHQFYQFHNAWVECKFSQPKHALDKEGANKRPSPPRIPPAAGSLALVQNPYAAAAAAAAAAASPYAAAAAHAAGAVSAPMAFHRPAPANAQPGLLGPPPLPVMSTQQLQPNGTYRFAPLAG